ncbi:5-oxoprolinase subunit C family protein [Psychroflexus aestuariivivens]|uniref:5-oxoprolinase subunit C family protein n=1 Tax=Psychroflexus aestuariivivens TaxID=1795040 RepID=UPI000FDB02A3|nr:biotin-dependent carboxyltransferase family protein [Psychroflexus aestuariivivens]
MSLKILKPGFFSSLQDFGRTEAMSFGVPISGVMDRNLVGLANSVLGNPENSAVIEFFQQGLEVEFNLPTLVTVSAIDADVFLNDSPIQTFVPIDVKPNDILKIKHLNSSVWAYLAVKNGFKSKSVFGSQSFYNPLTKANFSKGDVLDYEEFEDEFQKNPEVKHELDYNSQILEAFPGAEFHKLSKTLKYQLKNAEFSLSKNTNRMAYQIQERLDNELDEIITGPVLPGTIQFTPQGKLIVLMRDAQVTGGYPRILQLTENSINLLSQKSVKSKMKFQIIEKNS